jgi:riboflavin synthase
MFTGIIEKSVPVIGIADGPHFRRVTLASNWTDVRLTVAEIAPGELGFDIIAETLAKTNLGALKQGDNVHVERSLRIGDRLDGHFVQGHVDGTARLIEQISTEKEWRLRLDLSEDLAKFLTPKGSITIDGVSLTLAAVHGRQFEVALIPTTMQITHLARRPLGWLYNVECDVLAKTVISWLERSSEYGKFENGK